MLWHADVKDDSADSGKEKVESGPDKTDSSSVLQARAGCVAVAEGEEGKCWSGIAQVDVLADEVDEGAQPGWDVPA
jgi:hypothetical protein